MSRPSLPSHAWRVPLLLLAAAAALPLLTGSCSTAGVVLVFAVAAASCSLLLGYAGILSFAQGSFFGVGSYAAGLLLKAWPGLGLLALPASALAGAVLALVIGTLSTRQRGIYSVMITLAMAQLAYFAALSFPGLTGGENGLLEIPRANLGLTPWLSHNQQHYVLIALVSTACLALLATVTRSPFGRVLDAVRENDVRAETLGYDGKLLRLQAFALSGALTGIAGALYAMQLRSAPLSTIDLATSESILIMAILGGRRSIPGALLGAFAMIMMGEHLANLWPRWQMIVGAVLVAMVLFAPDGLSGAWARVRSWRACVRGPEAAGQWETT